MIVDVHQLFNKISKMNEADRDLVAEKLTRLEEKREVETRSLQKKVMLDKSFQKKSNEEKMAHYFLVAAEQNTTIHDIKSAIEGCPRRPPLDLMEYSCECKNGGRDCFVEACTIGCTRHIDPRLRLKFDRTLCRESIPMGMYVGTWYIYLMIERFCCRYISA